MKIELVPTIPFMLYINFCVAKREKYANWCCARQELMVWVYCAGWLFFVGTTLNWTKKKEIFYMMSN
jgi:predicted membrane protein